MDPNPAADHEAEAAARRVMDPDGPNLRSAMRTVKRAVENGWDIPPTVLAGLPRICASILADPKQKPYIRLRAAELLATLQRDHVSTAVAYDRMERLELEMATERIDVEDPEVVKLADRIIARHSGQHAPRPQGLVGSRAKDGPGGRVRKRAKVSTVDTAPARAADPGNDPPSMLDGAG